MTWVILSLLSALLLGFYDLAKKQSVKGNAVPIVLLCSNLTAALIWAPLIAISHTNTAQLGLLTVAPISLTEHALLFSKAMLVGASWTLAFFALKHLPISIAMPIRSTSPLWTIIIAVLFFGERPDILQTAGMLTILGSFYAFSLVGKLEGIRFHRDKWVACMIGATLLGAISAVYDKYLLQRTSLEPATVQAWFSVYLVPVVVPLSLHWLWKERKATPFHWRWTIPLIALCLLIADFAYFHAVQSQGALISVISPLRRTSIVIPFAAGILFYGEVNWQRKSLCLLGMFAGVILIAMS